MGLFFQPASGLPIKAEIIVVNEHCTLKVIVPALSAGVNYYLRLYTQSSAKGHDQLLKEVRDMKSAFTLKAS